MYVGCNALNLLWQTPSTINDTAHLHHIANHNIENNIVLYINAIVWILALPVRAIWLERFGANRNL